MKKKTDYKAKTQCFSFQNKHAIKYKFTRINLRINIAIFKNNFKNKTIPNSL